MPWTLVHSHSSERLKHCWTSFQKSYLFLFRRRTHYSSCRVRTFYHCKIFWINEWVWCFLKIYDSIFVFILLIIYTNVLFRDLINHEFRGVCHWGILGLPTVLSDKLHWNFKVNLNIFIPLRAQFCKISVLKKSNCANFPSTVLCKVRHAAKVFISNKSVRTYTVKGKVSPVTGPVWPRGWVEV
jgi:hypothetical protein